MEVISMKSQVLIISSYLAVILMVLTTLIYMVFILPFTTIRIETNSLSLDMYQILISRGEWTAEDLANTLIRRYKFEYVNVSIITYDILRNNSIVYRDYAVYIPVEFDKTSLIINRYTFSILYRNGYYKQYVIEVGYK
uniref:Uncharacterized protein n=1 Tax=Staphylothermus marinus TaxID=2280 RepID=A0A7C4H905_STAMA